MKNNLAAIHAMGIGYGDAIKLRRISLTLRRWFEHECNGAIQREGERGDGAPFWHSTYDGRRLGRAPDRECGALKRLNVILSRYPALESYVQGDPRGCALYLLRPGDVPAGADPGAYYNRGVAVF
jgi:hypothetical protein